MKKYVMALDAGTTSSRCILFDRSGRIRSLAQKEFTQFFPHPGWVEHDANELWQTQLSVAREAMQKIGATYEDIAAIGVANQRETTILWNRTTGQPVYHAIVWQCRRTADYAEELKKSPEMDELFRRKTGLIIDPYFSGTKIRWILQHIPGVRELAEQGELCFGTVDTWLIYKLTKGAAHVTDYSNASRTMIFNIHTLQWDEELCRILGIPMSILPEVKPSSCVYGKSDPEFFGGPIPISGDAGDQQAALFGQGCFDPGDAKNTYGTGCFTLMNTGSRSVRSASGLLTTVAWSVDGKTTYALEGSVFNAGSSIQWLRDELQLISTSRECDELAESVEDNGGVYLVSAFTGLGAPRWDMYARGTIVGLTRGSKKAHIARATLEGIAYQVKDLLDAMEMDAGHPLSILRVDGGASVSNFLMQFESDMIRKPIDRPKMVETTAFGAAFLAGLAVGVWNEMEDITKIRQSDRVFYPVMDAEKAKEQHNAWLRAVDRSLKWIEK